MKKIIGCISFLIVAVSMPALMSVSVANHDARPILTNTIVDIAAKERNDHAIDTAVSMLHQGHVVLRMGAGAQSHLLSCMNRRDKSYSHCGIVLIENGYPFVYHSIGGEDNPDARLRRDSACRFFSPLHNTAIAIVQYPFTPAQIVKLTSTVTICHANRPKFDTQFDLASDDKLYCTEFVYKAIAAATGDSVYIPTSSVANRRYISTDNLYLNEHASLVWQVKFK